MLEYRLLSDIDKKEIAEWKYEGRYEVYNLPPYFLMKILGYGFFHPVMQKDYLGYFDQGRLVGYTQLIVQNNKLMLGIGVHPNFLDQGYGSEILTIVDSIHIHRYKEYPLELMVRVWNNRAIHTYQKNHYKIYDDPFEHQGNMFYPMKKTGLTFYLPEVNELDYRKHICEDLDTMSFNGNIVLFPQEKWNDWYQRWNNKDHFYRYIYNEEKLCFVGEAAYRLQDQKCILSIIIEAKYRNQGIGGKVLEMLCNEVKKRGISEVYDEIKRGNPSLQLFLKHGFTILEENDEYTLVYKSL